MNARWIVELALLAFGLGYFAHRLGGRKLLFVALGSMAVRFAAGEALYLISLWHAPVMQSSQVPGGFWSFALDAAQFDKAGRGMAAGLSRSGIDVLPGHGFNELLGLLYFLFGDRPSTMLVFNAACAAACVPLAWLIARQAGMTGQTALAAAALVGLWPSSLAWSGQVLKDPLEWLGAFAFLAGGALLLGIQGGARRIGWGILLLLIGGVVTALLRAYALFGFGIGLAVAVALFLIVNRRTLGKSALVAGGGLGLIMIAAAMLNLSLLRTIVAPVITGAAQQASEAVTSSVGLHPAAPSGADQSAFTAAELAVWNARSDIRAVYQEQFPLLTPVEDMDVWLRSDDGHVDILSYAQELTGQDFRAGSFPAVAPHGDQACPPLSRLIAVRLRFNAIGGGSLVGQGQPFHSCGDIVARVPSALAIVFLFPLPDAWISGGSVGAARYLSAVDAVLLWLLAPGIIAGLVNCFRRRQGVNSAIAVGVVLLAIGMGLSVTNFGTLFRIRLEVLLPSLVLAVDGWIVLASALRRVRPNLSGAVVEYPFKGFQG